jgi:hypothetical protein
MPSLIVELTNKPKLSLNLGGGGRDHSADIMLLGNEISVSEHILGGAPSNQEKSRNSVSV